MEREEPSVLVIARKGEADALPSSPFDPAQHRTLESGLREWVGEQTLFDLGSTRAALHLRRQGRQGTKSAGRLVSVGYLALTRQVSGATRPANGAAGTIVSPGKTGAAAGLG